MDAVVFLAVLLGLAVFVAAPLYRPQPPARSSGPDAELLARREALVRDLQELEADHAAGMLAPDDYRAQRSGAEEEAAEILRRLDPPSGD
jgi:hypothetical protein